MTVALWIIAVCEVIRMLQNMLQLVMIRHDSAGRDNAYAEFVKSLKDDDRAFVKKMLKEFDEQDGLKHYDDGSAEP